MIDLKKYVENVINTTPHCDKANCHDIIAFFEDNDWFGSRPVVIDGKVSLDENQINAITPRLDFFLTSPRESSVLLNMLYKSKPLTAKKLIQYFKEEKLNEDKQFYVTDFLLFYLEKDLCLYTDTEIKELLKQASINLTKGHGDCLTFLLAWLQSNCKTNYYGDYTMDHRYTKGDSNLAYPFDIYVKIIYYLLNDVYIKKNDMFEKAANCKNYTDTWLYLSMHFISAIRLTDMRRIYHPDLPYSPQNVIDDIRKNEFSDNDARLVLLSITTRMTILPLTPNKTSSAKNITNIKFFVPDSCEVLFGKLFALAAAHRKISQRPDEAIIRRVSKYTDINRYMGNEIGSLFLKSDFRARSATKSYLQSIAMIADNVIGAEENGLLAKGYILAALARGHKGSYGEYAASTYDYLRDAALNGLTPEYVAYQLMERGVMSFISSLLLKMITNDDYSKLSVGNQTKLIQELDLSPQEIETVIAVTNKGMKQAEQTIKEVISPDNKKNILSVLNKIGTGEAFSKQPECLCLISALGKVCPYPTKRQCVGCKYEISMKSTLYLIISEYNRLDALYKNTKSEPEKSKYRQIIMDIILPKMDEMLECIRETYGGVAFKKFEDMIKENT